jgi:hypothetical protein
MYRMVQKLIRAWSKATDEDKRQGAEWYRTARETCRDMATDNGVTHECAAGVVAALSPRLRWSVNLRAAKRCLAGEKVPGVVKANLAKANQIAAGAPPLSVLSGPKVRAFYNAIMGDDSAAVVDIWVTRVVGWTKDVKRATYEKIATALKQAAEKVGTSVCTLQASVWVAIRGAAE